MAFNLVSNLRSCHVAAVDTAGDEFILAILYAEEIVVVIIVEEEVIGARVLLLTVVIGTVA